MKITAKIVSIDKATLVATGEKFLDVKVELLDGKKVVATKKFAYDFGTPKKQIEKEAKKAAMLYESEKLQEIGDKEKNKLEINADKNIADLVGKKIS